MIQTLNYILIHICKVSRLLLGALLHFTLHVTAFEFGNEKLPYPGSSN